MQSSFWQNLPKPIVGLSPMDGVTDAAFRYITAKYSKPDVILTEFTNVEGLSRGTVKLLSDFIYSDIERPIIAQIFGSTPHDFYKVSFIACEMGFDGIDINMGCPDHDVAKRGGGAALIRTPELAKDIIRNVSKGIKEWSEGRTLKDVETSDEIISFIENFKKQNNSIVERKIIPVSVKTRIGYDSVVIEEWVKHLLETEISNISIHGRTLKQMYTGLADWDAIGRAAEIIKKTSVTVLGNGDVKTRDEAKEKAKKYKLDGVLVGRAVFGNPYFFLDTPPILTLKDRLQLCKEHAEYYVKTLPEKPFIALRKHLAWYAKGFEGAAELRTKLVQVNSLDHLDRVISECHSGNRSTTRIDSD